jgi:hypothetical protein
MLHIMKELSGDKPVSGLLEFFTDEGDWAYVLDYELYGIVAADVTHTEWGDSTLRRKRIVIQLRCGTMYSVIRIAGITPSGFWEAAHLDSTGDWIGEEPDHYTINQLFNVFKEHAQA